MSESLGDLLIAELGRRGQRGMYFDYEGYKALPSLNSVEEMQKFFDSNGFDTVLAKNDAAWLADGLAEATEHRTPPWWASVEILAIITMPIWLLTRLPAKRRAFPRRRSSSRL